MIHASGGDTRSYELAVEMAIQVRRFLLVETDTAHVDAWRNALADARPAVPFLALLPRDGLHPAMPARSAVQ